MSRTYLGYGYTNAEGVATLDYDSEDNQLPKKSYSCHSRNTTVVAEASVDNVITSSNTIRFCENYVPPSETLSLTADKDILSYYDEDSAILTATYDGAGAVSGKSVVFKIGDTVLDTVTTDSNGVATYEYESQGIGDVTITAECMNLQETYELEDCYAYFSQSKIASWTTSSNFKISDYTVPTQHHLEIKYNTTPNCQIAIGNVSDWLYAWSLQGDCVMNIKSNNGRAVGVSTSATRNANSVYLIRYDNSNLELYQDSTQVGTTTTIDNNYPKNIRLSSSNPTDVEYIKIKPL